MDAYGNKHLKVIETVAETVAYGLGLKKDTFTKLLKNGPHILAPTGIDLKKCNKAGTILEGFHYDTSFLTIHCRPRYLGLYIWLRNGQRLPLRVPFGCLIIQVGK